MRPAYFDHNATSPLDPRVATVMERVYREVPGNPESAHSLGRQARRELEAARAGLAKGIGARPRQIIFTSGGTESDNLALWGAALAARGERRHLVVSAVEHPAVLDTARGLERTGYDVTYLPVDPQGLPSIEDLEATIGPDTFLVSIMLANNETGALLPVREMAAVVAERGIPFHTDAVQALGKIPVDVDDLGVDLLSAAAHKLGGPRGVGFLYRRDGTPLSPVTGGGTQEEGLRPGTPVTALAAGFARALEVAREEMDATATRLLALTGRLRAGLDERIPDISWNGPAEPRLPNTLNLTVHGAGGEPMLMGLDREGFCVSTGSACSTGAALPSSVLTAMGLDPDEVSSSLRLSLGPTNTEDEVEAFLEALPPLVARLRSRR
ncbi:MAG: cysteine desulfurase family protein [Planctomycetota bacterium]